MQHLINVVKFFSNRKMPLFWFTVKLSLLCKLALFDGVLESWMVFEAWHRPCTFGGVLGPLFRGGWGSSFVFESVINLVYFWTILLVLKHHFPKIRKLSIKLALLWSRIHPAMGILRPPRGWEGPPLLFFRFWFFGIFEKINFLKSLFYPYYMTVEVLVQVNDSLLLFWGHYIWRVGDRVSFCDVRLVYIFNYFFTLRTRIISF